MFFVSYRRQ